MLPPFDLLCDGRLPHPRLKLHEDGIDICGDERSAAGGALAALQRWGDWELQRLGVEKGNPGQGVARRADHPTRQADDGVELAIWSERNLLADPKSRRRIGDDLIMTRGNAMTCRHGRRATRTARLVAFDEEPQR